jgi:hypothetical protein
VTAAGYITRETTIQTTTSRIDIIRDAAPFSLTFYRQFARDGFEQPHALDVVRSLRQAPACYLQTKGLSADVVRSLESAARAVVPMFTGSTFTVATFETGTELRPRQNGWIVVDTHDDSSESANCGQAYPGAPDGSIWINTSQTCYRNTDMLLSTFAHEIGHALGFSHVDNPRFLMYRDWAEGILLLGPGGPCRLVVSYPPGRVIGSRGLIRRRPDRTTPPACRRGRTAARQARREAARGVVIDRQALAPTGKLCNRD